MAGDQRLQPQLFMCPNCGGMPNPWGLRISSPDMLRQPREEEPSGTIENTPPQTSSFGKQLPYSP